MAKKEKTPQVEAPVVEAPTTEEVATVVDMNASKGLTQSEKLQFAKELRHRVTELKAEDNPPLALIAGYNMIRDTTFIDLAAGEIACGTSAMGFIFSGNETAYKALQAAAMSLGVTLPEFKTLPAPSKKQLEEAGLASVGDNAKLLTVTEENVSADTKKAKKKEKKINDEAASGKKEYLTDHTKIETDEQLKEALGFQLVNQKIISPLDRIVTTAQFYRSYLEAHAEKAADPKAELDKIHSFTLADLLQDISTMVPPSFTAAGFGKLLCSRISDTKSVVPAFELLKRCGKKRSTGTFRFTDEETAAFVRVLVVWKASASIAELGAQIKRLTEKDAKKNADEIAKANDAIKAEQALMSAVTNPSFDLADNFIAAYNNKENEMHESAVAVYRSVVETYYKDTEVPELEFESMLLNVQQHVGIDLNLFTEDMLKRDEYSEKNLIEIGEKSEEKEDESKN